MIKKKAEPIQTGKEIAVIGMAGRFPGASNIDELWNNLKNSVESISFFSNKELEENGVEPELINHPDYTKAKGLLEYKEYFDSAFFNYTPLEAEIMDPQIRIFHECAWEALEDAGYNPEQYNGLIGLYAGASSSSYWEVLSHFSGKSDELGGYAASHLSDKDYINTRISYNLNLKGPVFSVQTACSTSLVAIHLACRGLLTGECKMALAGGIALTTSPKKGYLFQEGMIRSPDGHCRTFDAKAKGIIGGEGAGLVMLKRLKKAIADRDHIYAVIKGSAINNDGKRKVGFTAPSLEAQAEVIQTALRIARVEPETISYIETHGTGTTLGDPVEIEALTMAFETDKREFCAIGSIKTNIGHLDAAAGVAGFIKTALALNHKRIPPSLHFENPNPKIDFKNSPFYVNAQLSEWKNETAPLRAGVSSFGIGGTNAHVIIEEYLDNQDRYSHSREYQLILLSAKTQSSLDKMTKNLAAYFKNSLLNHGNHENPVNPGLTLADAAYTLQVGRKAFCHRRMLVCPDIKKAIESLSQQEPLNVQSFLLNKDEEDKQVVFMFPGQGAQYVNMGLELYRTEPLFREAMNRCFEILRPLMGYDIKEILYPHSDCRGGSPCPPKDCFGSPGQGDHRGAPLQPDRINQTEIAQPLLFIFEYALAQLLMKWGIKPYAMIGHSIGEYVAACLASVFSLEDAIKLVVTRGKLMQGMPPGAMLSVSLSEEKLNPRLRENEDISLAAVNSDSYCVVSGPFQAIVAFEKQLKSNGHETTRLHTSHAFHSRMMDPVLDKFEETVKQIKLNSPQIPYISNVTGDWIIPAEIIAPTYWTRQLRSTVRFYHGLSLLLKKKNSIFVEIGPGKALSTFLRQHRDRKPAQLAVNLTPHPKEKVPDDYYLLSKIGQLWMYGVTINWKKFYENRQEKSYRISLPTYSFEHQHYWIEESSPDMGPQLLREKSRMKKKKNPADWFYSPAWTRSLLPLFNGGDDERWEPSVFLVYIDDMGLGTQLIQQLKEKEQTVISVKAGSAFTRLNDSQYIIAPHKPQDYFTLFNELRERGKMPETLLHLWNITALDTKKPMGERIDNIQYLSFFSLVYQVQAIEMLKLNHTLRIMVVSNHIQEVTGEEELCPEKSITLGPVKVIPQEYRNISCRSIDILFPSPGQQQDKELINRLLLEFSHESHDTIVAYRGKHRWVQSYESVPVKKNHEIPPRLRNKGVYLVTGGLGNIGLTLAEYLAKTVHARLVLTGRSDFPGKNHWNELLDNDKNNSVAQKITRLQNIEKLGAVVLVKSADVANENQMQTVIKEAEENFGPINGVIHCAGIGGEQSLEAIRSIKPPGWEKHAHPRIYGLLVLEKLFKNKPLDFCLLMSSLSSVLGGLGFTSYAAANILMDAYVLHRSQNNSTPWTSINWDGWNFNEKENSTGNPGTPTNDTSAFSLTSREGVEIFEYILSWYKSPRIIVVSTGNLNTRIKQWIKFESLWEESDDKQSESKTFQLQVRPHLSQPYVAPQNQLEQQVAHIWQEFLGIEPVGTLDNFFELGGDSLKAVALLGKIHKTLNIAVPINEFFSKSTVKELVEYISGAEVSVHFSINPVEKKEYYSLSSAQKRLYILQQLDLESVGYNQYHVVLLEGKPDRNKLEGAFKALIQRHEVLRTSLIILKEEVVQEIHDHVEFEMEYYDLATGDRGQTTGDRRQDTGGKADTHPSSSDVIRHLSSGFMRPFVLSHPPFFRVGLIERKENQHILMVDMHHIITDGFSFGIFVNELMLIYGEQVLPSLKLQYKDYSEWQNTQEQQEFIKSQVEYWLKEFEGDIPVLDIHTDYPRPTVQGFEGSSLDFELGALEVKKLKELGTVEDATLFMVLIAIFNISLAKLSGQEDIIIGSPVAGRRHTDLKNIMGMFVNTLTLRNKPNRQKTFRAFLKEVKENALKAFENQDYPFEYLVEQVAVDRDVSRNPLFDVMFVLQNMDFSIVEILGLKLSPYKHKSRISKFDLELSAMEAEGKLLFSYEYCTKLFKQETIERFISYFKKIITSILIEPAIKILDIEIISEEEKEKILFNFNDTDAEYPRDKTIHELFVEQVKRTPDNMAVLGVAHELHELFERESLEGTAGLAPLTVLMSITYKELNEKSNQLAYLLKEKGVESDSIVGIMVERSIEMIIGILGILKASGAYLPIDPGYPEERTNYMLTDSSAKVLVTTSSLAKEVEKLRSLEAKKDFQTIFIDSYEFSNSSSSHLLNFSTSTSSLAYVIYTSGSTGKPKGVMVEHQSVVNRINWMQKAYSLHPQDVILHKTPFTFDVSVWELFWWSFQGASICLLGHGHEKFPGAIIEAIDRNKVTTIHFVPSMLNAFLEYLENTEDLNRLSTLKHVFVSGEALSVHHVERFNRLFKRNEVKLINLYGPTEATVDVSYFNCPETGKIDKIPIGKPIDNIRLYVVNKGMSLQPIGIPGELCLSGVGLARGYLNNPELTPEKFRRDVISHSSLVISSSSKTNDHSSKFSTNDQCLITNDKFSKVPNDQCPMTNDRSPQYPNTPIPHYPIYMTGDLARWLPDGNIEFIGRKDHQVKVRGYRIDLGEIEYRLLKHNEIKETVVKVSEENRENRLCAYIVSDSDLTVPQLREHLAKDLPEQMIPEYFIKIDKIPLKPNGKVDRKTLDQYGTKLGTGTEYMEPGNESEEIIANIWKEVLNLDKVSVNDSFFEIGGNSLSIIKVNRRLKKTVDKDIPLVYMFRFTTIRGMARFLDHGETGDNSLAPNTHRVEAENRGKDKLKNLKKRLRDI